MTHGIEISNTNGFIQIGESIKPLYTRIQSGSATLSAYGGPGNSPVSALVDESTNISIADDQLLWAFRPKSNADGIWARPVGGKRLRLYSIDTSSITVEYCVFTKNNLRTAGTGYGINIFDASSSCIYTSDYPPLSVETVLTIDLTSAANSVSYTFDNSPGLGRPWILATAGLGAVFGNSFSWEEYGDGNGEGDAEWDINGAFWTSTAVGTGQSTAIQEFGVTEQDFYNTIGVTYSSAKIVILRGYDYNT